MAHDPDDASPDLDPVGMPLPDLASAFLQGLDESAAPRLTPPELRLEAQLDLAVVMDTFALREQPPVSEDAAPAIEEALPPIDPNVEPFLPLDPPIVPLALLPPASAESLAAAALGAEPARIAEPELIAELAPDLSALPAPFAPLTDDAAFVEQLVAAQALPEFDGLEIIDDAIDEATLVDEPSPYEEPSAIEASAEEPGVDDAAADEAAADAPLDLEEFIVFSLADTRCVVPIRNVVEVGRIPDAAPVPNAPAWLHGLGNLRGQVLSLIDLRAFLGLGRIRPSAGRMIVLRADADDVIAGLMVDQVHQIVSLSPSRFQPAPATLPPGYGGFVWGVCEYGSHAMIGLDVDGVLGAEGEQSDVALAV